MKFSPPVIGSVPAPFGFGFGLLPIRMYGVIVCSCAGVKEEDTEWTGPD